MNLNEEVEVLKGVPLFSKIEPAKLKLIAFTSERMTSFLTSRAKKISLLSASA